MTCWSLYINLCNCLILICSIQHQMKVNLWTKKQLQALANELVKNLKTPEDLSQFDWLLKKAQR